MARNSFEVGWTVIWSIVPKEYFIISLTISLGTLLSTVSLSSGTILSDSAEDERMSIGFSSSSSSSFSFSGSAIT